jgi:hypothetical protein
VAKKNATVHSGYCKQGCVYNEVLISNEIFLVFVFLNKKRSS